ncbi:group III truncated hemoglobin [Roseococcus sp. YIM B11640]|uniref:group III truncated hemoglobin n=1 Tax=Roseococcus sp. YIM B11640 TaxID=3133973 RepID=UPI003C7B33D8
MTTPDGIDEASLAHLVQRFYERIRADALLGPVFEGEVDDWPAHLQTLADFWSGVMLRGERYKGNPAAVHMRLREHLSAEKFARWLALWKATTEAEMPPEAAALLQERASRIARSLQMMLDFVPGARPQAWTPG